MRAQEGVNFGQRQFRRVGPGPRGREIYKKRSRTVEPVFGQVKDVRDCDRFMRRGLDPGRGEWSLICATHNLLKLWRSGRAARN